MNKSILAMKSVAYYSGWGGIEIKGIEYGIEDYVLCISNAWYGKPNTHRVKIYYDKNDVPYFKIHGHKIPMDECIRMGV
jgi:hypothetical protein